jgi:hypothetical protein
MYIYKRWWRSTKWPNKCLCNNWSTTHIHIYIFMCVWILCIIWNIRLFHLIINVSYQLQTKNMRLKYGKRVEKKTPYLILNSTENWFCKRTTTATEELLSAIRGSRTLLFLCGQKFEMWKIATFYLKNKVNRCSIKKEEKSPWFA